MLGLMCKWCILVCRSASLACGVFQLPFEPLLLYARIAQLCPPTLCCRPGQRDGAQPHTLVQWASLPQYLTNDTLCNSLNWCCRPGQRDGSQPDGDAGAAGAAGPNGALPPEGCVGWQGCAWGAGQCGLCMAEPACCNHCKVRSWTGHSRTGVVMLQLHRAWLPNVPPPRCAPRSTSPIPSSPPSLTTSCCCTPARPSTLGAGRAWWATLQAMAAPAHSVSGALGWWSWLSQSWSAHVCRPQLPLPEVCSLWGSMSWRVRGCIANTTTTNIAIHVTACLGADTNPTDYAMSLMKTKGDDLVAAWAAQASQLLWRCCAEAPQRRLGVDRGGACMCSSGAAAF